MEDLAVGRLQELSPPPVWRRRLRCCWLEAVMNALAAVAAKDGGYGSASTVHRRPVALSVPLKIMWWSPERLHMPLRPEQRRFRLGIRSTDVPPGNTGAFAPASAVLTEVIRVHDACRDAKESLERGDFPRRGNAGVLE